MMGRISATSNPTKLKEIDRKRTSISISEEQNARSFMLDRLDLEGTGLPLDCLIVVIAKAGNTSARYEFGNANNFLKTAHPLENLDPSQPLRFRILIHENNDPKLLGSIENIRARDDSQSDSLLPMEPAKLGERLWKLIIAEDGPILQFNSDVFPNASGAENFKPFGAMVLPEALRRVMGEIAEHPESLSDEGDPWFIWAKWLESIGAEMPPEDCDEVELKENWCDRVVDRFCQKFLFASSLKDELLKGTAND